MKDIIDQLGSIKIKDCCSVKDVVKRMRRQACKDTADKGLFSKIHTELLKFNKKKQTQFNMGGGE